MALRIDPASPFRGRPRIGGDKSISHRALLFAGLARGRSEIYGLSDGADVRSTWNCLERLGVRITREADRVIVESGDWHPPALDLDCGNSGTSLRLLLGCLAGRTIRNQNYTTLDGLRLIGDESLSGRPMGRVAEPLRQMGADITLTNGRTAPVTVRPRAGLHGIDYELPVASAQVKSAILLAGLNAEGTTRLTGQLASRDHTERWLPHFGASLRVSEKAIEIDGGQELHGARVDVPGDPSSAAFWAGAAALGGELACENLLLNPTRTGFFRILRRMGAVIDEEIVGKGPEPVGRLRVRGGALRGVEVAEDEVASAIDELPMLAVVAAFAEGRTVVRGASELRVKETDRIAAVAENLRRLGGRIETFEDGFAIEGGHRLHGAELEAFGDHRIAMAFAIAATRAEGSSTLQGAETAAISYPSFFETLQGS